MIRKWAPAALCAAAALLAIGPASSHEAGIPVRAVVDRIAPKPPGVTVGTGQSVVPYLTAENGTERELVVLGERREPFLRIAGGAVETNLRSPTTYRASNPLGGPPPPPTADAAGVEWKRIGDGTAWRWFDPRVRPGHGTVQTQRWSIPMRLGESEFRVDGHLERIVSHGHLRTVLDRVQPQPQALEVKVLEGVIPAIFVRNGTGKELSVPGQQGEPFLRIAPDGVHANTRSPTYYLAGSQAVREVPATADAGAEPAWTKISPQPVWAWLEYRARVPRQAGEPFSLGPRRRTVLRWTTPATLGGDPLRLEGHVDWIPAATKTAGRRPLPWPLIAGAGVLLGAGTVGVLAIRRRPGAGAKSPEPAP